MIPEVSNPLVQQTRDTRPSCHLCASGPALLSGRYKAQLVEGSGNGYLKTACDYVHLNPVRAGLLKPEERLLAYPWSSMAAYVAAPEHRPKWVRVNRLLGEHGLQEDSASCRQQFEQWMGKAAH